MKKDKFNILDGSSEEQDKIVKEFLSRLTPEEIKRSMSDEFAYLDDDDDE